MRTLPLLILLSILSGCQDNERLARLEKENESLKAELQDKNKVRDYDLEVRCSKDAKAWFREGRFGDKTTTMLIMNNHYQASSNQCIAFIEEHSKADPAPSWVNEMSLYNVYENERVGHYFEEHNIDTRWNAPKATEDKVVECEMLDQKCTTLDQFNAFVDRYMRN
jgi:hypothetical protein